MIDLLLLLNQSTIFLGTTIFTPRNIWKMIFLGDVSFAESIQVYNPIHKASFRPPLKNMFLWQNWQILSKSSPAQLHFFLGGKRSRVFTSLGYFLFNHVFVVARVKQILPTCGNLRAIPLPSHLQVKFAGCLQVAMILVDASCFSLEGYYL